MKAKTINPILITMLLLAVIPAFSQQENYNKQWVQGIPVTFKTTFTPAGPVNQFWDSLHNQYFGSGHCNICTGAGELLLATDGGDIYNANREIIDNGDTITSSVAYDFLPNFPMQSTITLPLGDSIYYVFNSTWSDSAAYKCFYLGNTNVSHDQIRYQVVDMKQNNYAGKVVKKNRIAIDSAKLAASNMTAVRHGNGRDWWLIKQAQITNGSANKTFTFLVKQDTVIGPNIQSYPNTANGILFGSWSGQSAFNNSGTKYAAVDYMRYLFMADFDRCTGLFSNPQRLTVPMVSPTDSQPNGACFSSNDSFLYVSTFGTIFQFELNNPDSATAWVKIAGEDTLHAYFQQYVSMQLGHDQKIYIGHESNTGSTMSVIDNPNAKGTAADFCPMCLHFPLFNGTTHVGVTQPPNMPNYVLGIDPKCPPGPEIVPTVKGNGSGIKLYPNPATSSVTIEYAKGGGSFQLSDMLGRILISQQLPASSTKTTISTASLAPGVYIYKYQLNNTAKASGRLVIKQ